MVHLYFFIVKLCIFSRYFYARVFLQYKNILMYRFQKNLCTKEILLQKNISFSKRKIPLYIKI